MNKILVVFGTRPEAIKLAPVIKVLKNAGFPHTTEVCVTAQHREMLDQVLNLFGINPDYDLNIMRRNQNLFNVTTDIFSKLQDVFIKAKPSLVLVQGDTTTAFVAGLVAFYLKIAVGHVEAGLRTKEKYSPFPEEINRHLLSVLADYHFAPTERNRLNLIKEGTDPQKIWVTGNTVVDALFEMTTRQNSESIQISLEKYFLERWKIHLPRSESSQFEKTASKLILVTCHRRESFGEKFRDICLAIKEIAEARPDAMVVYPVHLNPNVQVPVKSILGKTKNVFLIDPVEYEHFVFLMNRSFLILTDSGGVQEEAPSLGKPVLLMRETTERPEGVEIGAVRITSTDRAMIVRDTLGLLDDKDTYQRMARAENPYGDGRASTRIVKIIASLMDKLSPSVDQNV